MTDDRFDDLTRTLGKTASRRAVFKGVLAAALGGLLTRAGADDADAFRGRRGCGRLGQDCGGTNPGCCVGLTCGADDVCCAAAGAFCLEDDDCCSGACDAYSHTCLAGDDEPCDVDSDCASGFCDPYVGVCVDAVFAACSGVEVCTAGEQVLCGSDATADFGFCVCVTTTDDRCACVAGVSCEGLSACDTGDDCPDGSYCVVTGCRTNAKVCVRGCAFDAIPL